MSKAVIYHEEAKRLFVREGFSLDAIVGMLNNKVSRKTLFNWKKDNEWDAKREEYLAQAVDLSAQLLQIADLTVKKALKDSSPKNLLAMCRAISALKSYDALKLLDTETTEEQRKNLTKEISPENLAYIKNVLYGLK